MRSPTTEKCGTYVGLWSSPLALDGAELMIWEEFERIELRLEDEGLGWKKKDSFLLLFLSNINRSYRSRFALYLHVHCLLRMLPHQAVSHNDQVSCLARSVRGEGGGRVADGTLQIQRAAEQHITVVPKYILMTSYLRKLQHWVIKYPLKAFIW